MIQIIGYLFSLAGIYALYSGDLIIGGIAFAVGGFIATKLFICLRSAGVVLLVVSISYGYHFAYTAEVLFLIALGFLLACMNIKHASRHYDNGWGIDIQLFSGDSGSGGGSDFGGSDGGGGGD